MAFIKVNTWELCHWHSHRLQKENDLSTLKQNGVINGSAKWGGGISCTVEYSDSISVFSKIIWYAARWCFSIFVSRKLTNCNAGKAERFDPRVPQQTGCRVKDSGFVVTIFFHRFLSKARNEYEIFLEVLMAVILKIVSFGMWCYIILRAVTSVSESWAASRWRINARMIEAVFSWMQVARTQSSSLFAMKPLSIFPIYISCP